MQAKVLTISKQRVIDVLTADRIIDSHTNCWSLKSRSPQMDTRGKAWKGGYIRVMIDGIRAGAHQWAAYAYLDYKGVDYPLHECDNPSCWNPAHLYIGSLSNNVKDMWQRKRRDSNGVNHPRAIVTPEIAAKTRELSSSGYSIAVIEQVLGISKATAWRILSGRSYL